MGTLLILLLAATPAFAAAPDAAAIVQRMKAALEPDQPSTRRLTITVTAQLFNPQQAETTRRIAGQARKALPDGRRMLTVVLSPESERGVAILAQERKGQGDALWIYLPAVRRARAVLPLDAYQSFLGTDFTYSDLGFVDLRARHKLLGTMQQDGVETYKIESLPQDHWYYSRILTWIATDSSVPVRREFYDPPGTLWKVQTFPEITRVDGVPTIVHTKMDNVRQGGSTDIHVDDVHYGGDIPDDLFDPKNLPAAATSAIWSTMAR